MKKKKISFQKIVDEMKKEESPQKEEFKEKEEKPKSEEKLEKKEEIKSDIYKEDEKREIKIKGKSEAVMGVAILSEYYAIPIEDVVEISEVKIVPAPEMPDFLDGITEIRGEIIPVIDPAKILGIGSQEKGKIILVDVKGELIGFKVTEIIGMIKMKGRKIYSLPEPLSKLFLTTAFEYNNKIFGILDISNLLKDEFLEDLKKKK